jgi:NADH:ubiquinone oxidoreductase subunit 2 (subunit N)
MIIETIKVNEMVVFPELFLGICIIYFFFYGTFTCYNNQFNFPIIQTSISYLSVLTLILLNFLLINDNLNELNYLCFNNSITSGYLSFGSKLIISFSSIVFLLMIQEHLLNQKISHFEYILIFLFALLGIFLLCSSNDLVTVYLSIELQSLAFYILAAFKKNSTYSIEAGLKYFVLGAFSSGLFLFGSSLIYGISGSINFADFKDLFFWAIPGYAVLTLQTLPELDRFELVASKIFLIGTDYFSLSEYDCESLLLSEFESFNIYNTNSMSQSELRNLFVKEKFYNQLVHYFKDGLYLQSGSEIFSDRGSQQIKNSDVFDFYGSLFPSLVNQSIQQVVANQLENSYLQNYLSITGYIPYFMEPDNFQTKKYFYEYETFDISLLQFALIFILISLFFKLALAPFHTWSPAIYEGSPTSTTFFFVVIPKLGIFVLLLRILYTGFYGFIDSWRYYVVLIAILSVIIGAVAGLEQRKLKSLLAYSSISHMGYLLIAFSTGSFEGIQMIFNYLFIYMLSGLCIWSVFVLTRLKNSYMNKQNKDLGDLVSLNKSNHILALIFATSLFSIAGLPPTIGFLVKINIFLSAIESSIYFVALISILFTVISTFYYIRIIKILYFEPVLVGRLYYPITTSKAFVIALLFFSFFFFFINPTALYLLSYKIGLML